MILKNAVWSGAHKDNFATGRMGLKPKAVVIHIAQGSYAGTLAWFQAGLDSRQAQRAPRTPSSSHFVVSRKGHCSQCVLFGDTAFHAVWNQGLWKLRKAGIRPNWVTVGIENEGNSGDGLTEAQMELNAWLIAVSASRYKFEINTDTVIPHSAIDQVNRSRCPGPNINFGDLITLAKIERDRIPD